ncbi:proline racemase family protein [Egibacter rhizosphaerae]|nr:proline racemase family protein [Egibacter rhizosphaerae]
MHARQLYSLPEPPRAPSARLHAIDSHTGGEPTRVIFEGLPELDGASASELRDQLAEQHDWVRRASVYEPRGHNDMFVAALYPGQPDPAIPRVVFMSAAGYPDMCGHATIGVATTLVEMGWVDPGDEVLTLDVPGGLIEVSLQRQGARVHAVTFRNQPAFHLKRVAVPGPQGDVPVDVAYGGQWYGFLPASAFGLRVVPEELTRLQAAADEVRSSLVAALETPDPRTGSPPAVANIVWYAEPASEAGDARNVPIAPGGVFDRSPCGTATCARLAVLHAQQGLEVDEPFVNEGILGTRFHARIRRIIDVEGYRGVIPEVTGDAWLTGVSDMWIDDQDPLGQGFVV